MGNLIPFTFWLLFAAAVFLVLAGCIVESKALHEARRQDRKLLRSEALLQADIERVKARTPRNPAKVRVLP